MLLLGSDLRRHNFVLVNFMCSPHIETIRERICLGRSGEMVSGKALNSLFKRNKEFFDQSVELENGRISHFEVLIHALLLWLKILRTQIAYLLLLILLHDLMKQNDVICIGFHFVNLCVSRSFMVYPESFWAWFHLGKYILLMSMINLWTPKSSLDLCSH